MRFSFPRTISFRVVLGFSILLVTFGGVSGYTVLKMRELAEFLRFVRLAHLEVSPRVAELRAYQAGIVGYLDSASLDQPKITSSLVYRRKLLEECEQQLASLGDVPAAHSAAVGRMRGRIATFRAELETNAGLYEIAVTPRGADALAKLKTREVRLQGEVQAWYRELRAGNEITTSRLEEAATEAKVVGGALGAIASFIGLLVTLWVVTTLRPFARLRDGVRKVASGDYRERVEVTGETEVADVAREFNAMAAAIQERELRLVRSERLAAVGKMAAVITHEIRNPLSSIGLNAELLEDETGSSQEAAHLCRAIRSEVDRLTAITEDYLRFARLPRPRLERESLNDIVEGLIEFQGEELGLAGITVKVELAAGLPPVLADESQLRQALLNLVRNAADAMRGGGVLGVSTAAAPKGEDGVVVRISDTGPGIAPEVQARIFEPFFSTKEHGTGLGLALCQEIVAEHAGRIDVESAPAGGTTFIVRLPSAQGPPEVE